MYDRYSLILMLTHNCTMRCDYCYMGQKRDVVMPAGMACHAIDRATRSLVDVGTLELGFFGGEPLLEAHLILELLEYARHQCQRRAQCLEPCLTTNGTVTDPTAWVVLNWPGLHLAVSCDGIAEVHDAHRRFADGRPSSATVHQTIRRLVADRRDFRVAMVVRPDTLDRLLDSARMLRDMGVRHIEPALDLWTNWSEADERRLASAIAALADFWGEGLPSNSIGWFDEKTAQIARLPIPPTTRCGFGDGAVAVAPSGRLYPCERLIGDDRPGNPMRLPGHASDGSDFLHLRSALPGQYKACNSCAMEGMCNTFCRCSNYARTGDTRRPDSLLCTWNQACLAETARVLAKVCPGDSSVQMPPLEKLPMEPLTGMRIQGAVWMTQPA